ncbi:hypothetical protein EDD86DRAFT_241619, partial [Gorgonomyces haynaldii]
MSDTFPVPFSYKSTSNTTLIDPNGEWRPEPQQKKKKHEEKSPYKPTVPYAQLITNAIESRSDKKITLNEIYNYAMREYEYFKTAGSGWKNSIRHNLSLNKNFVRVARPSNEKGKGAYWTLASNTMDKHMKITKKEKKARSTAPEQKEQVQEYEPYYSYLESYPTEFDNSVLYDQILDHSYQQDFLQDSHSSTLIDLNLPFNQIWPSEPSFPVEMYTQDMTESSTDVDYSKSSDASFKELEWINHDQCEDFSLQTDTTHTRAEQYQQ